MTHVPVLDERLPVLADATEHLRDRDFQPARELGSLTQDETVGRLATALGDLAGSLEAEYRQLQQLDLITTRITQGLLLEEILDGVYEGFRGAIPFDRIGFSLLEDGGRTAVARWARSSFPVMKLGKGFSAPLEGSTLKTILETGQPRILNDLETYLANKPESVSTRLVVEEGVRSSLTCPLVANGVPVGFLFFSSREKGTYSPEHVGIFLRIARQLSVLVEKGRMVSELAESKRQVEARNRFICEVFGRYLSDDVVHSLLETPDGLKLGGHKRRVTILMSDLRGFTSLSEALAPEQVVSMLNAYLGTMTAVITKHGGTIDELIGDAILVVFGAPAEQPDHARRAVACALEMQLAMAGVNARNRELGYPDIQMGIGVNTGEVVVGNIGPPERAKYGVVGSQVNLTSRIEAYTVGGQILVSQATRDEVGPDLSVTGQLEVEPKGVRRPITIFKVAGLGGREGLRLSQALPPLEELEEEAEVRLTIMDGPAVRGAPIDGRLLRVSAEQAVILAERRIRPFTNLKIELLGPDGETLAGNVYAKVEDARPASPTTLVNFTSVPEEAMQLLASLPRK